jgi:hypothetical protein
MSANDIMPWGSPLGGHIQVSYAPMKSGETFRVGEPVSIDNTGNLTESGSDPVPMDFAGIALAPAGYTRNGTAVSLNPVTGANFAAGDNVPFVKALPGQMFISANFSTGGSGVTVMPLANATADSLVGESAGMVLTTNVWFVDSGSTAARTAFRIEAFLDANKTNINWTGLPAAYVVVSVVQSAYLPITDATMVAIA